MLIHSHNKGIYERIVTAKNGQLVRVTFTVVEVDGILRGQIISAIPIVSVVGKTAANISTSASTTNQLCLPTFVISDIEQAAETIFVKSHVSPYASFEFFMSQPTRAPSL